MKAKRYAAAWGEDTSGVGLMRKVQPGDIVLLYANRKGIVAVGRAKGICEEDRSTGRRAGLRERG